MAKKINTYKIPPKNRGLIVEGQKLAKKLKGLIGEKFVLSGKPRTDGSTLRRKIEDNLKELMMETAPEHTYRIIPAKKKGVPKILLFLADSYLVTTGEFYNLQVWNRIPNSKSLLVEYNDGNTIRCDEIFHIMVKIDCVKQVISSIVVATPQYIEEKFGKFGVPTIKYQAIINQKVRTDIITSETSVLQIEDTKSMQPLLGTNDVVVGKIGDKPCIRKILPIDAIVKKVSPHLVGYKLEAADTKSRGQALERKVATLLGYSPEDHLLGGYPDIRNQALEIKVQDAPTIDLGKISPCNPIPIIEDMGITSEDVRYLIALTNPKTLIIEGIILVPGKELVKAFTMVSDTSYKCQRNIPMAFFDKLKGQSVFNP